MAGSTAAASGLSTAQKKKCQRKELQSQSLIRILAGIAEDKPIEQWSDDESYERLPRASFLESLVFGGVDTSVKSILKPQFTVER